MTTRYIELVGFDILRNNLRRMAAEAPNEIDKIVGKFAKEQRAVLKSTPYPPKLPNQQYVRTGNLANRWRAERRTSTEWRIINSADYAVYVVGPRDGVKGERQAWMHAGRWWIAEEVVQANVEAGLTEPLRRRLLKFMETGA